MVLDPSLQTCKYYLPPERFKKKKNFKSETKANTLKLQHSPKKKLKILSSEILSNGHPQCTLS